MATTTTEAKAKELSATERTAQLGKATAAMKKHSKAFNAYRTADRHVRAAKQKGERPEPRYEHIKDKSREGHNAYMKAYRQRRVLNGAAA